MNTLLRAHRALDAVARWPVIAPILRRLYDRQFENNPGKNLFRGVFPTFEAALASAPANRPHGYDNESSAALYVERTRRIYPTDYPVLYWLRRLLDGGSRRVFDLGGHIGVSYYAYRAYLDYPADLRWTVHDVPAVMAKGREVARQKDAAGQLDFADRFEQAAQADVLMALGSLQYLPETLAQRLQSLPSRPRHLLLNLTPLHERHSYFTLQGIGTAYCPYRVDCVDSFLSSFDRAGYDLVDTWENPEKRCEVPFHPDHSLDRYHGFHFRLRS